MIVLTVFAVVGLIIFIVGAILFLLARPSRPVNAIIMVVGGLVWALATVIAALINLF
jgi:hypothetical protein